LQTPTEQLEAYFASVADAEAIRAIEAWIQADPDHAKAFFAELHFREVLGLHLRGQANETSAVLAELARYEDEAVAEPVSVAVVPEGGRAHEPALSDPSSLSTSDVIGVVGYLARHALDSKPARLVAMGLAAAACLALMLVLIDPFAQDPGDRLAADSIQPPLGNTEDAAPIATPVATITAIHNAAWSNASAERASARGSSLTPGSNLHPGDRLTLTAGFAEITTNDGAIAILQAPATVELLDNDNAIHLHAGKLVGLCHTESSKGFVVKTAHADITDLGTEFGVALLPDGVKITVFVGEIAVKTTDEPSRVITHGQTGRVTTERGKSTLQVEDRLVQGFARRMPRPALVTAASINDDRFRVEVMPQGLQEDAKVHTDRAHEINGVDSRGLPTALLGADVILTPGDARPGLLPGTEGLKIEIETSRPAQVYLILNDGAEVPAWIGRDFVKTDMTVGIDYGQSSQSRDARLGIGPGQSIDAIHSVWRRKQPVEGRALVAEEMTRFTAYALLAVPAQETP
jgi:ferric-dicitrate binding protein FerR (iron transport regulator)